MKPTKPARLHITIDVELLEEIHASMLPRESVSGVIRDLIKVGLETKKQEEGK